MRPSSILWFERLFLFSLALGLLNGFLGYESTMAQVEGDPGMAALGLGTGFLLATAVIGFAVPLLLWYFIARRGSDIAKWILVILTAVGLFMLPGTTAAQGGAVAALTIFISALQVAAITFLFRKEARAWLADDPKAMPEKDPGVRLK